MMPKDLIAELKAAGRSTGGTRSKIDVLFGDQPDVLEAIRAARANGASHATIARILSSDDQSVKEGAVRNWLFGQGIE